MVIMQKKNNVLNVCFSFLTKPFSKKNFLLEKHFGGKLMFHFAINLNHLHG